MRPIASLTGRALPLIGPNIDTDRIIPARFLRTVSFEGLDEHVFEDDRAEARKRGRVHPFDDAAFQEAAILVVNENFGCGSSREHAPQALYRRGIRAVIGESFSEIFFGNALMIGMPCVTAAAGDIHALQSDAAANPSMQLTIDLDACEIAANGKRRAALAIPPNARDALLTGAWDATALLLDRYEEVERTAARLPYVSGVWPR